MTMTNHVLRWPTAASRSAADASPAPIGVRPEDLGAQLGHMGLGCGIIPTLRDFHIDPAPIITAAGLDPNLFNNGTRSVSCAALARLLTLGAVSSRCPHFGLLVGSRTTLSSLGIVGRLMQHSPTVGDALRNLIGNIDTLDLGGIPSLTIHDDLALFTYSV